MILVEQHQVNKNHKDWEIIDNLCFLSKNLYNVCLFKIKQHKIDTGKFLRYSDLERLLRDENNIDYFNLPTASSQQTLRLVDRNLKSYFALLKKYKSDKKSLNGCPKFPKYKDKVKGRSVLIIRGDTIRLKNSCIHFPKKFNLTSLKTRLNNETKICEIRIIPQSNYYKVEIVYEKQEKELINNNNVLVIDLGINNLMSCISNKELKPLIINGKPLKSINQYYNKKKGKQQSQLEKNHKKKISNKLNKLTLKHNNKIKDYLHKSSRIIVNYCIENNISKVIVGYNKEWKQNINLGKTTNQNFVNIPFLTLVQQLQYKLKLEGIEVVTQEESYTSKCSALDLEPIEKHEIYLGKRIKRGLFQDSKGVLINADINGAINILRKVTNDDLAINPISRGFVFNPIKITSL